MIFGTFTVVSVGFGLIIYAATTPIHMDEYFFIRVSKQLPAMATTADWVRKDKPELLETFSAYPERFDDRLALSYDQPIRAHPPAPAMVAYPLVKLTDNIALLRMLSIAIVGVIGYVIYRLLKRRVGYRLALTGMLIPLFSFNLLGGLVWFYRDSFMFLFFFLTWYFIEVKPSKWRWLTAILLVNSKFGIGLLLLLPLLFRDRKLAYASLSILPFWLGTVAVTGNPFYLLEQWQVQGSIMSYHVSQVVLPNFWNLAITWGLIPYALLTLPCLKLIRREPAIVSFYLIILVYAFGTGWTEYLVASIIYSGVLAFPLVLHHFLGERVDAVLARTIRLV